VIGSTQSGVPGSDKDEFPAPPGGAYGPGSKFGQQQGPYGQQAGSGQVPYGQQADQKPAGRQGISSDFAHYFTVNGCLLNYRRLQTALNL
jgi:hypothetical protein